MRPGIWPRRRSPGHPLPAATQPGATQINGDTASSRAYLSELIRLKDGSSHLNYAFNHDRYQRTADGWKFTERVYQIRSPRHRRPYEGDRLTMSTSEAWREPVTLQPIGVVRDGRTTSDDDYWGGFISTIELDTGRFGPDALAALDTFSHVIVVFHFHLLDEATEERGGRHPRGREDWPVAGILAQRAKRRPNRMGMTTCRLVSVNDTRLTVEGLDAMAGTPVLDLKPYMVEFEPPGDVSQPAWSHELMAKYFAQIPPPQ